MKLEREVRHKSEDIDDDVLLDAVQAIRRRVRVVREYDVPTLPATASTAIPFLSTVTSPNPSAG